MSFLWNKRTFIGHINQQILDNMNNISLPKRFKLHTTNPTFNIIIDTKKSTYNFLNNCMWGIWSELSSWSYLSLIWQQGHNIIVFEKNNKVRGNLWLIGYLRVWIVQPCSKTETLMGFEFGPCCYLRRRFPL